MTRIVVHHTPLGNSGGDHSATVAERRASASYCCRERRPSLSQLENPSMLRRELMSCRGIHENMGQQLEDVARKHLAQHLYHTPECMLCTSRTSKAKPSGNAKTRFLSFSSASQALVKPYFLGRVALWGAPLGSYNNGGAVLPSSHTKRVWRCEFGPQRMIQASLGGSSRC